MQWTVTDQATLEHIRGYIAQHNIPPTYDEIADHFGVRVNAAWQRVNRLCDQGMIRKWPGAARTLAITDKGADML